MADDDRRGPDSSAAPPPPPVTADERLTTLVRDYGRLIRHVIRTVGGRDAAPLAEDIEQVVLVSLWQQVAREQQIDHPASYVYRAAVRETIRVLKRERSRADRVDRVSEEVAAMPSSHDPHGDVEGRQQRQILARCLAGLAPDRERAVRAHLAGFSVAEIMELFGWSYQRARNLIARGMADLRLALHRRGVA